MSISYDLYSVCRQILIVRTDKKIGMEWRIRTFPGCAINAIDLYGLPSKGKIINPTCWIKNLQIKTKLQATVQVYVRSQRKQKKNSSLDKDFSIRVTKYSL